MKFFLIIMSFLTMIADIFHRYLTSLIDRHLDYMGHVLGDYRRTKLQLTASVDRVTEDKLVEMEAAFHRLTELNRVVKTRRDIRILYLKTLQMQYAYYRQFDQIAHDLNTFYLLKTLFNV